MVIWASRACLVECKVCLLSLGVKFWWSQLHRKELSGYSKPGGTGEIWPGAFNFYQKSTSYMPEMLSQYPQGAVEEERSSPVQASFPKQASPEQELVPRVMCACICMSLLVSTLIFFLTFCQQAGRYSPGFSSR